MIDFCCRRSQLDSVSTFAREQRTTYVACTTRANESEIRYDDAKAIESGKHHVQYSTVSKASDIGAMTKSHSGEARDPSDERESRIE